MSRPVSATRGRGSCHRSGRRKWAGINTPHRLNVGQAAQAQGRESVPSLLSSLLWAAGHREPLQVTQGATAILGARWEAPHFPLEPASPSKAESPQATGGG